MKRYLYLLLAAILFCGMGGMTSCSVNEDNPTSEELFENEMTAALADAQIYGPQTEAFAQEVATRYNGCVTEQRRSAASLDATSTRPATTATGVISSTCSLTS